MKKHILVFLPFLFIFGLFGCSDGGSDSFLPSNSVIITNPEAGPGGSGGTASLSVPTGTAATVPFGSIYTFDITINGVVGTGFPSAILITSTGTANADGLSVFFGPLVPITTGVFQSTATLSAPFTGIGTVTMIVQYQEGPVGISAPLIVTITPPSPLPLPFVESFDGGLGVFTVSQLPSSNPAADPITNWGITTPGIVEAPVGGNYFGGLALISINDIPVSSLAPDDTELAITLEHSYDLEAGMDGGLVAFSTDLDSTIRPIATVGVYTGPLMDTGASSAFSEISPPYVAGVTETFNGTSSLSPGNNMDTVRLARSMLGSATTFNLHLALSSNGSGTFGTGWKIDSFRLDSTPPGGDPLDLPLTEDFDTGLGTFTVCEISSSDPSAEPINNWGASLVGSASSDPYGSYFGGATGLESPNITTSSITPGNSLISVTLDHSYGLEALFDGGLIGFSTDLDPTIIPFGSGQGVYDAVLFDASGGGGSFAFSALPAYTLGVDEAFNGSNPSFPATDIDTLTLPVSLLSGATTFRVFLLFSTDLSLDSASDGFTGWVVDSVTIDSIP